MMSVFWILMGCQYLQELRDDPVTIQWSGNVYAARADESELQLLEDGAVDLYTVDGALIEEGYLPSADSPGFWRFDAAPANTAVAIRISGTDLAPTVWRGRSPGGTAIWLSGALYARELSIYEEVFEGLDGLDGITAQSLSTADVAALWGEPNTPIDETGWAAVDIQVIDGDGQAASVWRLTVTEAGELVSSGEDAVELFIAPNLAPGTVTLDINGAQTEYPAQGGDVLSATFYDLGAQ